MTLVMICKKKGIGGKSEVAAEENTEKTLCVLFLKSVLDAYFVHNAHQLVGFS